MSELKKCLKIITNRSERQEVGVVRAYPIEWDADRYPSRYKAPTLYTLDGKGSPNQHIVVLEAFHPSFDDD